MVLRECIFVRKEQFAMLPIFLPHLHDTASSYNGTAPTLLRKELPMKTNLSINYESYVRQLVKLAAFILLATPAFAQTYTITDLGTLGGNGNYSVAYCINGSGQVSGASSAPSNQMSDPAFLYSNGQMTDIGTLGGDTSNAYGINNLGVIAGYSYNASGNFLGFIYQNGTMTPIGTLGGSWSIAYAINDQNQIAGQAYTRGNRAAHAFRLSDGQMVDLGSLGGSSSWGLAINNSGTVVGFANTRSNEYHAFVSTNGGRMQDLNRLIPSNTGWVLGEANGINDVGQIVGYGTIHGQTHAFLLTPVQ